jgi:hypothetical protein
MFLLMSQGVIGQRDSSDVRFDVSFNYFYSFILTGRTSLQPFKQNHPQLVQLDLGIINHSQKSWAYCNCFSRNGVSFSYIDFENSNQLGHAFAISAFAEPLLISSRRFTVSLRASAGFAFLNKVYDSIANPENIFFSSKLSYLLAVGANASYQVGEHFRLRVAAQVNHISNGGKRDPNEGMNFPGVGIGMSYAFDQQKLDQRTRERFDGKSWYLIAHAFGSQRTAQANLNWPEEVRGLGGVNVGVVRRTSRINGIGGGGEIYYDGINSVFQQQSRRTIQTVVSGLSIQHYLFFGKLLFGQQFAWYITPNTGYRQSIYQRYFLEYELIENWYAGVSLKAHADHSDYLAFSVGRKIKL